MGFKEHAAKLAEIGDLLADDLSVKAHTIGLPRSVRNALEDWDEARMAFKKAEKESG